MRSRLDSELVRRHLARSREDARELIESGSIMVNGIVVRKASSMVDHDTSIVVNAEREGHVSRGAVKLAGALDYFGVISFEGRVVLDAGASTGGFTEIVLKRGASKVYAVDVGYGQLAWSLQNNPQVVLLDRTNIRELALDSLGGKVDVIVADLSFISLRLVIHNLVQLIHDEGEMFLMVKPQFEVGKDHLGAGGVVRESALRADAVRKVAESAWEQGFGVKGVVASSLPGPSGNVEYFLWLRKGESQLREFDLIRAIKEGPQ